MIKMYGKNTYVQSIQSPEWEDDEEGLVVEVEEPTTTMGCDGLDVALAAICGDVPYSAGWYSQNPAKGMLSFGEVTIGCIPDNAANREKLFSIAEKLSPLVGVPVSVSYYSDGVKGILGLR